MKFYKCDVCGKIHLEVTGGSPKTICCGKEMRELSPKDHDGALEKHLPVVEFTNDEIIVSVGEVMHPMTEEHYIDFVYVELKNGGIYLKVKDIPVVRAKCNAEDVVAVYEYCNLHGLWVTRL